MVSSELSLGGQKHSELVPKGFEQANDPSTATENGHLLLMRAAVVTGDACGGADVLDVGARTRIYLVRRVCVTA